MNKSKTKDLECTIECIYKSNAVALCIAQSLKVNDKGFADTTVEGKKIIAKLYAKNCLSLLHTINDFLTCMAVAERICSGAKKIKKYVKQK